MPKKTGGAGCGASVNGGGTCGVGRDMCGVCRRVKPSLNLNFSPAAKSGDLQREHNPVRECDGGGLPASALQGEIFSS